MKFSGVKPALRSFTAIVGGFLAATFGAGQASANEEGYNSAKSEGTAEAYSSFIASNPGSDFVGAALCDLAEIDSNEAVNSVRTVVAAGEDPTSSDCVEDGGVTETGAARLVIV